MPLAMMDTGVQCKIKKICGREDTRKFLEKLGFIAGGAVTVISSTDGSLIVNIKDSRIAIGKDMANSIIV